MNVLTIDALNMNGHDLVTSMRETGFAIIKNYPIDRDLIEDVYRRWTTFFNESQESKNYFLYGTDHSGYFPFKSENAKGSSLKDLKEFYHIYNNTILPGNLYEHFGHGAIVSPTHELMKDLSKLGELLLTVLFAMSPAVHDSDSIPYNEMAQDSEKTLFRILHYPPIKSEDREAVRAAAHYDINLITILPAATQSGLEVKDLNGMWHKIDSEPGTVVVNIGEMLEIASDGFFRATEHRVVNPIDNHSRYSMPLFIHPRGEVFLRPGLTAQQALAVRLKELGL